MYSNFERENASGPLEVLFEVSSFSWLKTSRKRVKSEKTVGGSQMVSANRATMLQQYRIGFSPYGSSGLTALNQLFAFLIQIPDLLFRCLILLLSEIHSVSLDNFEF